PLTREPIGPRPLRDDGDNRLVRSGPSRQLGQQAGIVLETEGARIQEHGPIAEPVFPCPLIVTRKDRQLVERRPVLVHARPRLVDSPALQERKKALRENDTPAP